MGQVKSGSGGGEQVGCRRKCNKAHEQYVYHDLARAVLQEFHNPPTLPTGGLATLNLMKPLVALLAATPVLLLAYVAGPDPRLTGAPGDDTCTSCHTGTVNSGPGSVKITAAGGSNYTPGVKQRITVAVSDPNQRRWGFELTARLASDLKNGQAGSFSTVDKNTQVICDNGDPAPCASASVVQFIEHTEAGTRNGTTTGVTFEFDWTPPATDVGAVTLYAAGNAANGNNQNSGDRIYTTTLQLTPAASTAKPAIDASGVANAASAKGGFAANTWITIKGSNLSATTRTWTADEVTDSKWPTALDNVSVTVNGKAAIVQSISPTQINALTPVDDATGPVDVKVTAADQTSDAASITLQAFAPAVFTIDGKYAATSVPDPVTMAGNAKFFTVADGKPTAVKPGDTVTLFATGLGPMSADDAKVLANAPTVTVGGVAATVTAAGLLDKAPQIYQISITVPDAPDGDQAIVVQVGGVNSPSGDDATLLKIAR